MQDQEKYKHKVRVSRRNWYIRFFCWAWDTQPEKLDICKLIWGTLALPLVPLLFVGYAVIWVLAKTMVEMSRTGRVRSLYMEFWDVKYARAVPAPVYGVGLVVMAAVLVIVGPIVAVVFIADVARDRVRDWRLNRKRSRRPRRIMTEENLGRISGGASERTARGGNVLRTIWFALPEPVRTALKWPYSIAKVPVLLVKGLVKRFWALLQYVWQGIASVPLWIYGIVGLLGVSVTLAVVFNVPVVLAALAAFGTVGLIWLAIRLCSKYRVIARIKEGGQTFGRSIAAYGRSLKYSTCPQIVVKD